MAISLTKVEGRHTLKTGLLQHPQLQGEQATGADSFGTMNFQQDTVGTNAFDTSVRLRQRGDRRRSARSQQASNYVEGNFVYDNREAYVQDNWKVSNRLTLDYGMRFVHALPQYDSLGQGTNFLPDKWALGTRRSCIAPAARSPCTGTACPAASLQALNPVTGQLLGPNTSLGDRHARAGHRAARPTACSSAAQGIADTTYTFPGLALAPRFGMAYDVTGQQKIDRCAAASGSSTTGRSATRSSACRATRRSSKLVTVRFGQLQTLGNGGLTTQGAPGLRLAAVWRMDGIHRRNHGHADSYRQIQRRVQLFERRQQHESNGIARLWRPRPDRRRSRKGLQQRSVSAVQRVGIPGPSNTYGARL